MSESNSYGFIKLCYGVVGSYKDTSKMTTHQVIEEFLRHESVSSAEEYYEKQRNNTYGKLKQEVLTNVKKDGTINNVIRFDSQGDPLAEVTGDAETSNPKEVQSFRNELKSLGVDLIQRDTESLGYAPAIIKGKPGTVYISKGASYGAWCHEMQHVRDDNEAGWSGMRILTDKNEHYMREVRAYQVEINIAKELGRFDIVDRLKENLEKERIKIYGK